MKTIRCALIILIIVSLISCINKVPEYASPQGEKNISLETLRNILHDIHVADAMLMTKTFNIDSLNSMNDTLIYENIFLKHNCSRKQFNETLLYYSQNHIDSLNLIYDKILEDLYVEKENNR